MPDRYLNYLYNNKYYNTKWLAWESGVSDGHDLSTAQSLTRAVLIKILILLTISTGLQSLKNLFWSFAKREP